MIDYIKNEDKEKLTWADTYPKLVEMAKEYLRETKGGKHWERESWFWNLDVQHAVEEKTAAFKAWQRARVDNEKDPAEVEDLEKEYTEKNKTAKTEVAKVKGAGYEEMYEDLKKNGPKNYYKLAKTRK